MCDRDVRVMGKDAVKFVNRLGDIAAASGRIPKGAFVRWVMQLLSETVQRILLQLRACEREESR